MLSKSQARSFFVFGTIFFSGLFLFLTFDTARKIPTQTSAHNITEEVVRGKKIWEHNNCMGCHTIFGEGAYYAPELTKVIERRGEAWIRVFLRDPQAMFPGQRKMSNYHFTEEEISDVIAFLTWIGEVDLNGFPPEPAEGLVNAMRAGSVGAIPVVEDTNRPEVYDQLCSACHSLAGQGGNIGPALDGVGERYEEAYLSDWLSDPQSVKAGTTMPKLPLTESDLEALVSFLAEQR